jgi:hypothetical protein
MPCVGGSLSLLIRRPRIGQKPAYGCLPRKDPLLVGPKSIEQVLGDGTCFSPSYDSKNKLILGSPGNALRAQVSGASRVEGLVSGYSEQRFNLVAVGNHDLRLE